jgi:hypothetical protein
LPAGAALWSSGFGLPGSSAVSSNATTTEIAPTATTKVADGCVFDGNAASQGAAMFLRGQDRVFTVTNCVFKNNNVTKAGAALLAFCNSALNIRISNVTVSNNTAGCCHAYGYSAGTNWFLNSDPHATGQCTSFDYGSGRQCCNNLEYIDKGLCLRCTAPYSCNTVGTTVATLPLPPGCWRESLTQLNLRECWNQGACSGGTAATGDLAAPSGAKSAAATDAYCVEGYHGPCKCCMIYILLHQILL